MQEKELIRSAENNIQDFCNNIIKYGTGVLSVIGIVICIVMIANSEPEIGGIVLVASFAGGLLVSGIIAGIIYWYASKTNLIVTDKRIYGTAIMGKRVDIPIDSVSAVGTTMLNGLSVASSSGMIAFWGLSNRDEIHKVISEVLIERQGINRIDISRGSEVDSLDELKKLKDLVDLGVISQEDFEIKKKQILGI